MILLLGIILLLFLLGFGFTAHVLWLLALVILVLLVAAAVTGRL